MKIHIHEGGRRMGRARAILKHVFENPYRSPKVENVISQLQHEDHGLVQSLGTALHHFVNWTVSPDEELWIQRIESIRNELLVSRTQITLVDYGIDPRFHPLGSQADFGKSIIRTIGEVCKNASMPQLWALLLFKLVRQFRPSACLELGTSLGISTAFQAAALTLNGHGRIMSLEGAAALASLAEQNLQRLGLKRVVMKTGRFQDTLGEALEELRPVDFAFIDGHHQEKASVGYFEQIVPFLKESAVVVFDDISWSEGMARAWKAIVADTRVRVAVDLSKLGICVVTNSVERKQSFDCRIAPWQRAMARMTFG